jgi:large subunit ribosomal protein L29
MKASEIREMSAEQMKEKLIELKKKIFTLRFQHQSEQLSNTAGLSAVRKDIARIYTISGEMNINIS